MKENTQKEIIVIGLIAPVGTKLKEFRNKLSSFIKRDYSAETYHIKLSDLIESNFKSELNSSEYLKSPWIEKIKKKIDFGNKLREEYDRITIFAEYAHLRIISSLKEIWKSETKKHFIIIDQFKRPEEIKHLNNILGSAFWTISINSPIENRIELLTEGNSAKESEARDLIFIDDKEKQNTYGQRLGDTVLIANSIFSDNFNSNLVGRFLDLLHGSHFVLPTPDEYYMNLAFSSSLKTGDLSRQVGAVLVSQSLDHISCGANEVNKFGGGSYWPGISNFNDLSKRKDPNKEMISKIKSELSKKIKDNVGLDQSEINKLLDDTKIDDLTEFHRTTHAEMDAILSALRNGVSVSNATLYSTTFPCHNCAKHIVSSGIKKVVYHEPYMKSLALELHNDSISMVPKDHMVLFEEFLGITHVKFSELFSMKYSSGEQIKRKQQDGFVPVFNRLSSSLRFSIWEESFVCLDKLVVDVFSTDGGIKLPKAN